MSENNICPACSAELSPELEQCDKCGFTLAGNTERIGVIDSGDSGVMGVCGDRGKSRLTLTKGPLKGEIFYLESFPVSIGREPRCDIFLNNMTVSREHAIIEQVEGRIIVKDQDSLNGTWVDGKCIEQAELFEGSLLQIGTFSMRFTCA